MDNSVPHNEIHIEGSSPLSFFEHSQQGRMTTTVYLYEDLTLR
jgi:hypothetical protein